PAMASFFTTFFQWLSSLFFSKSAEIAIVGLQASGKTSFVNVISSGQCEDVVPTVGFIFRKVRARPRSVCVITRRSPGRYAKGT
ncbi:unnamed protein product, partial [Mycena citricolor]